MVASRPRKDFLHVVTTRYPDAGIEERVVFRIRSVTVQRQEEMISDQMLGEHFISAVPTLTIEAEVVRQEVVHVKNKKRPRVRQRKIGDTVVLDTFKQVRAYNDALRDEAIT